MEQRQSLLGNKPQWAMFRIRLEPGDPQSFLFYAGPQGFSRTTLALGSHALLLMENPDTVQVELPGYGQDLVLDDPEKPLPLLSLSIDPVSDDRSNTTAKRTAIFQAELQWE
jgi:hypothetical protein